MWWSKHYNNDSSSIILCFVEIRIGRYCIAITTTTICNMYVFFTIIIIHYNKILFFIWRRLSTAGCCWNGSKPPSIAEKHIPRHRQGISLAVDFSNFATLTTREDFC